MIYLFLAQQDPPIPADSTAALLFIAATLASAVAYFIKRWADIRLKEAEHRITTAESKVESIKAKVETGEYHLDRDILLVDDDANDYELLNHLLVSSGIKHNLKWVTTPEEGYVYMRDHDVLVALVDLKMVSNGFRLLEIAKRDPLSRDVPVILISGAAPEDITMYQRGAIGFLLKPLQLSLLLQILTVHGFCWSVSKNCDD